MKYAITIVPGSPAETVAAEAVLSFDRTRRVTDVQLGADYELVGYEVAQSATEAVSQWLTRNGYAD